MATKKHANRTTAAEETDGNYCNRRHAKTADESNYHIRMNILAIIPGLLDTDEWHRDTVIRYLCAQYPGEVKRRLRAGSKPVRLLSLPMASGSK